jgi:hypothetical protein
MITVKQASSNLIWTADIIGFKYLSAQIGGKLIQSLWQRGGVRTSPN